MPQQRATKSRGLALRSEGCAQLFYPGFSFPTMHAFDVLERPEVRPAAFTVLFGGERFLQLEILRQWTGEPGSDDEFSLTRLEGDVATWLDVHDALATASLFSAGPRTVVVDGGDEFVKKYRPELERWADRARSGGNIFILLVGAWAANTRLYKLLDQRGLQVECNPPLLARGRSKGLDEARLLTWLVARGSAVYGVKLSKAAARQMLELNEVNLALYDQQLAKLACCVADGQEISPAEVNQYIGGWRDSTVWKMVDAALDGEVATAIELLRQLLQSGHDAIGVFAQAAWSMRRYANAIQTRDRAVRLGQTPRANECLVDGGFHPNWSSELEAGERRLGRLGLSRGRRLLRWLYEADKALKGSHSQDARSAYLVERLLFAVGHTPAKGKVS